MENGTTEVATPAEAGARHAAHDPAAVADARADTAGSVDTAGPADIDAPASTDAPVSAAPDSEPAPAEGGSATTAIVGFPLAARNDPADGSADAGPAWEAVTAPVPAGSDLMSADGRSVPATLSLPAGALGPDSPAPDAVRRIQYVSGAASVQARPPRDDNTWAGPTLFEAVEPGGAAPSQAPPGAAVHQPGRRRWWLAAVIVLVLIVGGIVAYTQLGSSPATPASAVQQYFADLGRGDTTAAMTLVDNGATYSPTAYPLLIPTAFAQAATRPTHLTVGTSTSTTLGDGRPATAVSVSYTAGASVVHQRITVITAKTGGAQPFLLEAPFVKLAVTAAGGRPVTINGISYTADAAHSLAFPGAYVANVAGSQLVSSGAATATFDDSKPGSVAATVALPAPSIAPNATAAVQSAVNARLESCASSNSPAPKNCPFSYHDSGAKMKWSIQSYPTVQVTVGGDGSVTFDSGNHGGSVHYEATTTGWFGFNFTDRGDQNIAASGTVTANGSTVAVTFHS